MAGRHILVTGGAGEIAAAIITALRDAGDRVTALDVRSPEGSDADFVQCDLGEFSSIDDAAAGFAASGTVFDGIVHTAGIADVRELSEAPRDAWVRVMSVNLLGTMALTQALLPVTADGASLVYLTSGTVFQGTGGTAYVASKAGLIGFARVLAMELGPRGIRVNTVAPGLTATSLMPGYEEREPRQIAARALKRREVPADVVGAVEFFLSPASAFITGQTLVVDGGLVRH